MNRSKLDAVAPRALPGRRQQPIALDFSAGLAARIFLSLSSVSKMPPTAHSRLQTQS